MKKRVPWNKGKTGIYSEETLRKIGEASSKRKHSDETKKKIGLIVRGRKHSEATKDKIRKSKLGSKNPMYGGLSEEHKVKISTALKNRQFSEIHRTRLGVAGRGKVMSAEARLKMSANHANVSLENNPNWQGGITPANKKVRTSKEYKNFRRKVFERDNYTCQSCGASKGYFHVHHIKPFKDNILLRHSVENGVVLCIPCHYRTERGKDLPKGNRWGIKYATLL